MFKKRLLVASVLGCFLAMTIPLMAGVDDPESKVRTTAGVHSPSSLLDLPDEVLLHTLGFLDINAEGRVAQVCKGLEDLSNDKTVWQSIGKSLRGYGLFQNPQDALLSEKEKTRLHYLRVRVNAEMDLETVNRLINHYNITYSRDASPIWKGLLSLFPPCLIDLLAAQKYQQAIEGRFYGLRYGQYGYPKDPAAARKLNDERVDAGRSASHFEEG